MRHGTKAKITRRVGIATKASREALLLGALSKTLTWNRGMPECGADMNWSWPPLTEPALWSPSAYFGMHYIVPALVEPPEVILAVNVGGAIIPTLLSIYLLSKNALWGRGLIATFCIAAIYHALAEPIRGA